ncbi:hypothetical protein CYMTET_14950 [Cymbomonas tetramitiformis]|uniref:Uncharacterized protein n=1 Tax=Cymbomonas tetramitiformis TaxID=36881 RepID=A0AAE0GFH1_9CHLO|nr:hypothetical protein CYMTET_14950 [Cymbomonas tetramitiformis]
MKFVKAWGTTTMLAGLAAAPAPAGGSGALGLVVSGGAPGGAAGAEGQYRKALAASQGKRDGWSVDRHKQVRANVSAEGAKLRAAGLRTVTEEQLQQALMDTLSPEAVLKPAGQSLDAQQAKLVLGENGRSLQWESANKRTRCSTLPYRERDSASC